jgi:hypothetical protein
MQGKHRHPIVHALATLERNWLRHRLAHCVDWLPLVSPEEGCTAIIGVCSRLPQVLLANLRCLAAVRWPALKRVILVVDCEQAHFPAEIQHEIETTYAALNPDFFYYSPAQSALAEKLKLPFVYSWLSWCIGLKYTTTEHVLFHDYDALLLGRATADRYAAFIRTKARVQGIAWYKSNGIEASDQLATTFEAFMQTSWLRSAQPIALFNKLRVFGNRSIDFDTTLDLQHTRLSPSERTIEPMSQQQLVHPSQMIHQYTMFRRNPGARLPSFSIPMIPFFSYLGGASDAIAKATSALELSPRGAVYLLADDTLINLSELDTTQVDWVLKQIVEACLALSIAPDFQIHTYGSALYRVVGANPGEIWKGDFADAQRAWINIASLNRRNQSK